LTDYSPRNIAAPKKPKRKNSRFTEFNAALDSAFREAGLTPCPRFVWVTIWRHELNGRSTVSYQKLAAATGYGRRSVMRAVEELVKTGFLKYLTKGHTGRPNTYRTVIP